MKVREIMTRDVVTVTPETPIGEAALLMATRAISGLPVLDRRGTVVGIVSEGDLILRQKARERTPWWRAFFSDGEALAREYQKAVGTTAGEVMTRSVVCVTPDVSVAAAASILHARRIRRLPVVADGRLIGIVSRGDLIRALANEHVWSHPARLPDQELVQEMNRRLARESWVASRGIVAQATDGIMSLWGIAETEAEKSALETMARAIPGVQKVDSHLAVKPAMPYLYWM
jgi:CBS-domain-containing membrane protein